MNQAEAGIIDQILIGGKCILLLFPLYEK